VRIRLREVCLALSLGSVACTAGSRPQAQPCPAAPSQAVSTPWDMAVLPPVTEESVRMRWEGITDHGLRLFLMDLTSSGDRIVMAYGMKPGVEVYRIESLVVHDGRQRSLDRDSPIPLRK